MSGMSQIQSQIGKDLKEEIVLILWNRFLKSLNDLKNRRNYVNTLKDHIKEDTFPTNLRYLDYKVIQFPKSISRQFVDAFDAKMKEEHANLKRFTLNSMLEMYLEDLTSLENDVQRLFGKQHISIVLVQHFGIKPEDRETVAEIILTDLQIKKAMFLHEGIGIIPVHSTILSTHVETTQQNPDTLPFPLTQLSQPSDSPARLQVNKKRGLEPRSDDHTPPFDDQEMEIPDQQSEQKELMEVIHKMAAQITCLQLKFEQQETKNAAGPGQAPEPWTGERKGGQLSSNRNRSGYNNNNNRSNVTNHRIVIDIRTNNNNGDAANHVTVNHEEGPLPTHMETGTTASREVLTLGIFNVVQKI